SARLSDDLRQEAQKSGRLLHPAIITIHELVEEGRATYLVMEFVDGKTLAELMLQPERPGDAEFVGYLAQAADALDYAHSQGVVPRDIKPSNLMITQRGQLKLADFGIAKLLNQTSAHTRAGLVRGTVHYMSPEQIGHAAMSGRSDQFSLAVLAYEWFT